MEAMPMEPVMAEPMEVAPVEEVVEPTEAAPLAPVAEDVVPEVEGL